MVCSVFQFVMERTSCNIVDLDHPPLSTPAFVELKDSTSPQKTTQCSTVKEDENCSGCGYPIRDRYIFKVMEDSYHEQCLRCFCCHVPLGSFKKCFTRHGNIYCEHDHQILYGKRCRRCMNFLASTDVVHRVQYMYYHSDCFRCASCLNAFSLGDEYYCFEGEIFCRLDYETIVNLGKDADVGLEDAVKAEIHRKTPKRPRTILNAQQRRQFKSAFERSSKPSRKVREQLANETGLSVRVVQVWFQNQRAKIKKMNKKDADPSTDVFKQDRGSEGRSTEDIRSSDEEELVLSMESDEIEISDTPRYLDPIQKLYNMTSSQLYFPYQS